jgi:hypothetical protein
MRIQAGNIACSFVYCRQQIHPVTPSAHCTSGTRARFTLLNRFGRAAALWVSVLPAIDRLLRCGGPVIAHAYESRQASLLWSARTAWATQSSKPLHTVSGYSSDWPRYRTHW